MHYSAILLIQIICIQQLTTIVMKRLIFHNYIHMCKTIVFTNQISMQLIYRILVILTFDSLLVVVLASLMVILILICMVMKYVQTSFGDLTSVTAENSIPLNSFFALPPNFITTTSPFLDLTGYTGKNGYTRRLSEICGINI